MAISDKNTLNQSKRDNLLAEANGRMEHHLPEEAIPFYTKALELDPNNAAVWNSLGLASFLLKEYSRALECFDTAIRIDPDLAEAWHNKGNVLVKMGQYPEAFATFTVALEKNPVNPVAIWADMGTAHYAVKEYEEAIACFDQALRIHPLHQDVLVGKGLALCQQGYFEEAMRCYDRALQINPLHAVARKNRKIAQERMEQYGGLTQRRIKDFS